MVQPVQQNKLKTSPWTSLFQRQANLWPSPRRIFYAFAAAFTTAISSCKYEIICNWHNWCRDMQLRSDGFSGCVHFRQLRTTRKLDNSNLSRQPGSSPRSRLGRKGVCVRNLGAISAGKCPSEWLSRRDIPASLGRGGPQFKPFRLLSFYSRWWFFGFVANFLKTFHSFIHPFTHSLSFTNFIWPTVSNVTGPFN